MSGEEFKATIFLLICGSELFYSMIRYILFEWINIIFMIFSFSASELIFWEDIHRGQMYSLNITI